jgi:quinol-cytochrome oxidoreductase complex cytochrome b subunit
MSFNDSYGFFRLHITLRQMSFWGAMVITSLLGALPGLGADILLLL